MLPRINDAGNDCGIVYYWSEDYDSSNHATDICNSICFSAHN